MAQVFLEETFRAEERFIRGTKELNQLALVDCAHAITKRTGRLRLFCLDQVQDDEVLAHLV
jgi:hypothetical protein